VVLLPRPIGVLLCDAVNASRRGHPRSPQGPSRSTELTTKPVATLMLRGTGADITRCPACHAGRLRVVALFRPGQIPVLDTS
jgi:hypothetical protein